MSTTTLQLTFAPQADDDDERVAELGRGATRY